VADQGYDTKGVMLLPGAKVVGHFQVPINRDLSKRLRVRANPPAELGL
jgi:hypothetical protein